jgi:hypothetical protein
MVGAAQAWAEGAWLHGATEASPREGNATDAQTRPHHAEREARMGWSTCKRGGEPLGTRTHEEKGMVGSIRKHAHAKAKKAMRKRARTTREVTRMG